MGFGAVLLHKELVLNAMDNHFPKDDKTRIGGFNAPPPADGRPPEVHQPPTPNPFWQSPPPEEAFPPAAAPPAPEPYRPPQPAEPSWPPQSPEPYQPPSQPVVEPYSPPQPVAEPYRPPQAAVPSWPPPAAEPYQPPPQPAAAPYRPPQQPVAEPYRPPQPAEPYRPPQQPAADLYQLSSQQDDMWFVVDLPGNPIRFPLRFGEVVTLGRDASQNIVIDDKTLSRNHLVMQRNGDRINVQVLGLNGLVYANQIHKSTTLEIAAPATLTIGNVTCKIDKKADSDATVLMSNPAAAAQQRPGAGAAGNGGGAFAGRPASPAYPPPAAQPWGESQPFSPAPPEGDKFPFPSSQPIPPVFPAGQQTPGFPPPSYAPPSFDFGSNPPPSGGSHGGAAHETPGVFGGREGLMGNKNLLFIGGGIGAAVLVVGLGLFFWLRSPAPVQQTPPPPAVALPAVPLPQPAASGCASGQGTNHLYAKYLSKARVFLQEGNKKDACDYLKDIPQSSACWAEAVELAKQIEDCRFE